EPSEAGAAGGALRRACGLVLTGGDDDHLERGRADPLTCQRRDAAADRRRLVARWNDDGDFEAHRASLNLDRLRRKETRPVEAPLVDGRAAERTVPRVNRRARLTDARLNPRWRASICRLQRS